MHVLSQLCSCAVLLLSIQHQLSTSLLSRRNIMLFRVESTCSFFHVKKPRPFYFEKLGAASAPFRVTQVVSRSSSILRVWSGTTRIRLFGCGDCHLSVFVRARFVMFCGNIMSHGLQSISVFLCVVLKCFTLMGLVTVALKSIDF